MSTQPTREDIAGTRGKFYDLARQAYPGVADPGAVWVLTEVLGWSWEDIRETSTEGFGRQGYKRFKMHVNHQTGKDEIVRINGSAAFVTRKWTKQEKSLLKDWWWLLNL